MTCDNCHEDTTTQQVKVGFMSYQQWCSLCAVDHARTCDLCHVPTAPSYQYSIYEEASVTVVCKDDISAWAAGLRPESYVATAKGFAAVGIVEACCEPDWDASRGGYVHQDGCHGSVEANEEAEEA